MKRHIHFIGIGGIGMSGLAQLWLLRGAKISGSDLRENNIIQQLQKLGAEIFIGHKAKNIEGADTVIYSSAIKEDNPEILAAKRKNILLLRRAQALAELMQGKSVVTITGSHGKTTTTSLVSCLLLEAGFSPTVAIGGILKNIDANAYLGEGNFFVAEADESDGSFLYYYPKYSIITNIDYEHLDYYKEFKNIVATFKQFIYQTDKSGCVFACYDDYNLRELLDGYQNEYILFGLDEKAQIYPKNIKFSGVSSEFDVYYKSKYLDRFFLPLGGMHNISNALAVIALGLYLKIDLGIIKKSLANYKGAGRRIEIKYKDNNYLVLDDYAHHPTEIKATILAIKNLNPKRIIAIFQPHRYSRTKLLFHEFANSFNLVDLLIITDIYPAGESPLEGITSNCIYDEIRKNNPDKKVYFLPKEKIIPFVLKIIEPKDLIITLGAGDITKTANELVEAIKRKS